MKSLSKYIVGFILGVLVAACLGLVYLVFNSNYEVTKRLERVELIAGINKQEAKKYKDGIVTIEDVIKSQNDAINDLKNKLNYVLTHPPSDGKDGANGYNGKNGANGVNGTNGSNGTNGKDGYTPQKGVDYFDGKDGADGKQIEIRCNTEKNRWEYRYQGDLTWTVMEDQDGNPTKCRRAAL